MKLIVVALVALLTGCLGSQPTPDGEPAAPARRVTVTDAMPARFGLGARLKPPTTTTTPPGDLRVVADERLRIDQMSGYPQLAVDGRGHPHVTAAASEAGVIWRGHWTRDDEGHWRSSPKIVRGGVRGFLDIGPSGAVLLYSWSDGTSTTEVRDLANPEVVVDRFQYLEVYQPLRSGSEAVGVLGTFGGNLYLARRGPNGWEKEYFSRRDASNQPVGVVTAAGRVAVLGTQWLSYFGGGAEALTPAVDRAPVPFGPAKADDGSLWILRSRTSEWDWGNALSVQRRSTQRWETPIQLVQDAPPPGVENCPSEHGLECRFEVDGHIAVGLVVRGDRPIPILVRTTRVASYKRECLQRDPNFNGCTEPPCMDEGGPRGPWSATPQRGPTLRVALLVDGHEVPLREPLRHTGPFHVVMGSDGRVHFAFRDATAESPSVFGVRYLVVQPPAQSAPRL